MALLIFLRYLLIFLGIALVATQVLIPLVTGTILFPIFRKSREVLLAEKAELTAQIDDTDLQSNVISLKQKLAEKQAALQPKSDQGPTPEQKV